MRWTRAALIAVGTAICSGCYHAVVETGRPAGGQVIDQPWAKSFIFGLVPPPVVQTASACPNGVAKVETEHTFLNQLVGGLTFGIFTPMHIRVTCASGGTSSISPSAPAVTVPAGATDEQKRAALTDAAELAARTHSAVFVRF